MIVYKSNMSKTKKLAVLLSLIKTANEYTGSLSNKKVKELMKIILDEYPNPLYRKNGTTLIKNNGKVYGFKLK